MRSYDIEEVGGWAVVPYLEVATQLGKVPTPIIMYVHMMGRAGGGVKNCFGY